MILKTWPEGFYRQEAYTAITGPDGRFVLPELIPSHGRYAIQVAALKDGFAFKSFYQLVEGSTSRTPDPITLQLDKASSVTLIVRDQKGVPIPNAAVFPSLRKSKVGENHLVYFQGSESVHQTTDAEGRVRLNCFHLGDSAEIYLHLPESDWKKQPLEISSNELVVEVASAEISAEE